MKKYIYVVFWNEMRNEEAKTSFEYWHQAQMFADSLGFRFIRFE